jgi:ferric-dicitrate binding protein FerR (iron transport regulator)
MDKRRLSELLKSNVDFKMEFDKMIKLRAVSFVPQIDATKEANFKRLMEQLNENVPPFSMSRTWNSRLRQIAAIIIFVVSVSVSLFYIYRDITTPGESTICYETVAPIGSQTKIILPDSTIVWLNSGSFLKYSQSFGKKNREVALSGEGYFVVKKDKSKPFLVHTVKLDVKVMGTVFNVRAYNEDEDVEVNLIEGVVNVSFPENKKAGSLTMKPNEKLVFNKQSKHVESFQTDAYRSALWTSGKLCFVDATIEQISKDLERKYEVKIQIENKLIKKELFSGSLNLNLSLKEILSYIDVDKKFKISQVGDTIKIR